jgi:hypothetical protein
MSERGSHSARGAHIAWAATRPQKRTGLDFAELSGQWERRARAVGSDRTAIVALLGRADQLGGSRTLDEHRFGAALSLSPDGAARRRDVAAAFGAAALAGAHARSVESLTNLWTPELSERAQVGVAEDTRTLRSVVPGGHLLRALGPRPVNPADHEVWRDAAQAIDGYRGRWNVSPASDALGTDGLVSGISSLPTERLVDHLRTARHIDAARQRLGWRATPGHEMARGR